MTKKLFTIAISFVMALALGCSQKPLPADKIGQRESVRWEYKTVFASNISGQVRTQKFMESVSETNTIAGKKEARDAMAMLDYGPNTFLDPDLEKLGADGWELVSCVPEVETIWLTRDIDGSRIPEKSNVRTKSIKYIFKRPLN